MGSVGRRGRWVWLLGGQLAVELNECLHELILESDSLELEGRSEESVLNGEKLVTQHDRLSLNKER